MALIFIKGADGNPKTFQIRQLENKKVRLLEKVYTKYGRVLGINAKGELFNVVGYPTRARAYHGYDWPHTIPFAEALLKFKLISKDDWHATVKEHNRKKIISQRANSAYSFYAASQELGLKMTKSQEKEVKKILKENKILKPNKIKIS